MKGVKNDYSMSFFVRDPENKDTDDSQVLFLEYVHNTDKAITWLKSKGIVWDYANIYERRTRKYIERVYNPFSSNISDSHLLKQKQHHGK